jgi:subtilisin family serine protease
MQQQKQNFVHYLWHLGEVGILDKAALLNPAKTKIDIPAIWTDLESVKVAVIDTGCTRKHPNLDAIAGQLDLSVHEHGAIYRSDFANAAASQAELEAHIVARKKLPALLKSMTTNAMLIERANAFAASVPREIVGLPNPGEIASGHGTACAGLIAARTTKSAERGLTPEPLTYFGVNPAATIIPVATPFSPEISSLINAVFHAIAFGARVILLPRGVNPVQQVTAVQRAQLLGMTEKEFSVTAAALLGPRKHKSNLRYSRLSDDPAMLRDQLLFEELLIAVSKIIPVVLPAGNGGMEVPEYPASLLHSGGDQLFVVGAANSLGYRASYSSGLAAHVSAFGPGDDEESIGSDVVRYDADEEQDFVDPALGEKYGNNYSPFAVLAIEPPLRLIGTVDEEPASPHLQPVHELYSSFGGTSAASSIFAGLLSLKIAKTPNVTVAALKDLIGQPEATAPFGKVKVTTKESLKM